MMMGMVMADIPTAAYNFLVSKISHKDPNTKKVAADQKR
jgi:hypothetical protein